MINSAMEWEKIVTKTTQKRYISTGSQFWKGYHFGKFYESSTVDVKYSW